jgi:metal-dependent amidase/aminoacylase/carboxypeptidase family protein
LEKHSLVGGFGHLQLIGSVWIGGRETHPDLHRPDYDFNDDLLETATRLYRILINKLMWPDPA